MNSFFIAVALHSFFAFHDIPAQPQKEYWLNDTTINHSLDGKADEWSAQKFEIDPATQFKYAIDNDKQNLYLVLSIANFREQIKIIRQGMDLYFDPKEKKKEGKGIEFPVKKDPSAADMVMNYGGQENGNTEEQSPEQRKAAMRKIRAEMALSIGSMKVFGFSEDKSEEQGLKMPGSANIAFGWDSTDVMNIEYRIPLSFFGTLLSTDQKDISIGWKVNGFQFSSSHSGESSPEGGRHGGGGYSGGGHRGYGGGGYGSRENSNNQQGGGNMMKDESFWTKYTFRG